MPIRTNRGRDAVYRRLWAWPMHNPVRLGGVMAGLVVVAVLASVAVGAEPHPASEATPDPATAATSQVSDADRTTRAATSPPSASRIVTSTAPAAPGSTTTAAGRSSTRVATIPEVDVPEVELAAALTTADAWARAWTNHPAGITATAWADQMRPLSTEEHWTQLLRVDPAGVPATTVTGAPTLLDAAPSLATVEVPTDGPRLRLTLLRTPEGWRVDAHDRAEP